MDTVLRLGSKSRWAVAPRHVLLFLRHRYVTIKQLSRRRIKIMRIIAENDQFRERHLLVPSADNYHIILI